MIVMDDAGKASINITAPLIACQYSVRCKCKRFFLVILCTGFFEGTIYSFPITNHAISILSHINGDTNALPAAKPSQRGTLFNSRHIGPP